jgi:uncharacterized surface protein with fasciclin (FAS1) repeats
VKKLIPIAFVVAIAVSVAGSPATARQSDEKTIVQTARTAGTFKTLTKLVRTAGLAGTLSKAGPYTVFAPTDAAFRKVPKSTLASLAKNRAKLRAVLLYHVVAGSVPSSEVVTLKSAKTLNGKSVRIRSANGSVFVNRSRVTKPDIGASNGIIHVVNRVLIPPAR